MKDVTIDFSKSGGLVPVIVQKSNHRRAGKVLMLAYANEQALRLTMETGLAHFWSRSRKRLWKKGETSGHTLEVETVLLDCDGDTLLYCVFTRGPVCHTGEQNCFGKRVWRKTKGAKVL